MIKILILEDQGLVRAGMRELIHICEPDAQILESNSFEDAIQKMTEHHFDFAFLDYELKSTRTGIDVLKYIREQDLDTRAIMLSGHTGQDLVLSCLNAGACGFIFKDLDDNNIFRNAIDTVLNGGIFIPASVSGHGKFDGPNAGTHADISLDSLGVSGRLLEVLGYLCQGLPNKSIANKMNIEEGTIRKDYVPKLFRIFKVARRIELLIEVSRLGLQFPRKFAGQNKSNSVADEIL